MTLIDKEKEQILDEFSKKFIENQKEIESEFIELIDDYFWELL